MAAPRASLWSDPRTTLLAVLGGAIAIGGGLRLRRGFAAGRAVDRLGEPDIAVDEVRAMGRHGRAVLRPLFDILSDESRAKPLRHAAGAALADLWKADELIPEEEQALVRRGFEVEWDARRRYPRGLRRPIPIAVRYGVPFLAGVIPLEWSRQVIGTNRMEFEKPGPFVPGPASARFTLDPADIASTAPHRLILKVQVRSGSEWEIGLPHMPLTIDLDPRLDPGALLALPDSGHAGDLARRLTRVTPRDEEGSPVPIGPSWALASVPEVAVDRPLPRDVAARVLWRFGDRDRAWDAGPLTIPAEAGPDRLPLPTPKDLPDDAIEHPGPIAASITLVPDVEAGWGDPTVRSIWPDPIELGRGDVRLLRH